MSSCPSVSSCPYCGSDDLDAPHPVVKGDPDSPLMQAIAASGLPTVVQDCHECGATLSAKAFVDGTPEHAAAAARVH